MRTPRRNGVPADRPRHFCDGGGAGRIASLVPRGAGGPSPAIGTVPHGRPDRPGAQRCVLLVGDSRSPRARHPVLAPSPPWLSPSPCFGRARRCSLPQALLARRAHPASARAWPLSGFCPSPPPVRSLLRLLAHIRAPRVRPGGRKRAFACGVPGALRGTWVSPTRFDE